MIKKEDGEYPYLGNYIRYYLDGEYWDHSRYWYDHLLEIGDIITPFMGIKGSEYQVIGHKQCESILNNKFIFEINITLYKKGP